jgi:hypothetical protein
MRTLPLAVVRKLAGRRPGDSSGEKDRVDFRAGKPPPTWLSRSILAVHNDPRSRAWDLT